jgi:thiosulfate dehydrogenase [quinone] large subunit
VSTASGTQQVTPDSADEIDHGRGARIGLAFVRITIGLLWIQSAGWKTPPEFGRDSETGLFKFSTYAVDYPVFGPFSWLMENVVLPNFTLFGYLTLFAEASLGAFLLVGLATRFWAVIGIAQTIAITLSVLNGPNEFPWTYYLMFAAHVVILTSAAGRTAGLDGVLRPRWRQSSGRIAALMLRAS